MIEAGDDTLGSDSGSDRGVPGELLEPERDGPTDGAGPGGCPGGQDHDYVASDADGSPEPIRSLGEGSEGGGNPGSVENLEDGGRTGCGGDEGSTAMIDADAAAQPAADNEFESTPDDNSDPLSKMSSECEGGYSSDDTSELSEGEKLAFELRRAEIRKGKAREGSLVPSEAPAGAVSDSRLNGQPCGDPQNGSLLPVAGPAQEGDPDVVYVPWERDAGRPLQKLPIRLRDLNGRTFLLPWEQVKTWNVRVCASPRLDHR